MTLRTFAVAGATLLLAGCAAQTRVANSDDIRIGNAIVIEDESFEPARGNVLSILQLHVRGMTVSRADACPRILVRAGATRSQAAQAIVYVDGQRMSDTCILDGLDVDGVSRAEVYPSGVTQRPGYHSNTGGLILLFMKNGSEAPLWSN